ncbi:NagC family transcriptional regulator, partial [Streptomyces sp. NPDC057540]
MTTTTPHASRRAGDGRREANAATVLRTVLDHGPVARGAVARLSGLSPAAVSRQATDLTRLGLLRELPELAGGGGVGRPQIPVDLHVGASGGPVAGGVHLGVPGSTFALVDLRGQVLARHTHPHDGIAPDALPGVVARALRDFLDAHTRGRPLLGVGAAVGGWVDPAE